MNQLRDISISEDYAGLCGIMETEMDTYFTEEISVFAKRRNMTVSECREALRKQYDGYHFHPESAAVYNPYSLLNAFLDKEFGSYWFETGTMTFLVKRLRRMLFDIRKFTDWTLYVSDGMLKGFSGDSWVWFRCCIRQDI